MQPIERIEALEKQVELLNQLVMETINRVTEMNQIFQSMLSVWHTEDPEVLSAGQSQLPNEVK